MLLLKDVLRVLTWQWPSIKWGVGHWCCELQLQLHVLAQLQNKQLIWLETQPSNKHQVIRVFQKGQTSYRPGLRIWNATLNDNVLPFRHCPRLLRGVWQITADSEESSPWPRPKHTYKQEIWLNCWVKLITGDCTHTHTQWDLLSGVQTSRTARKSCRLLSKTYLTLKCSFTRTVLGQLAVMTNRGRSRRMLGSLEKWKHQRQPWVWRFHVYLYFVSPVMSVDTVGKRHLVSWPLKYSNQRDLQSLQLKKHTSQKLTHAGDI